MRDGQQHKSGTSAQPDDRQRTPTFLIGGAAQSGTSFLAQALRQHPQIYLPARTRPEPHYFYYPDRFARPLSCYLDACFRDVRDEIAIGEKSSSYLFGDQVAARIAGTFPSIKFVFVLRNPVDRAFSNHRFTVLQGLETRSFEDALEGQDAEPGGLSCGVLQARPFDYLARGLYARQLARFEAHFPASQILILKAEDMFQDPQGAFRRCFGFLEVDPDFVAERPAQFPVPCVRNPILQKELRATIGSDFPDILDSLRRGEDIVAAWAGRTNPATLRRLRDNVIWEKRTLSSDLRKRLKSRFSEEMALLSARVEFDIREWF